MLKFVEGHNPQAALRDRQPLDRNAASEKNFIVKNAVRHPMIRPDIAPDKFKLFRGYIEADLLLNFTHDAVQEALVTFAAATKKI